MRHLHPVRVAALSTLVAVALLAGCRQDTAPAPTQPTPAPAVADRNAAFESAVDAFIDGAFRHYPTFAAGAGKHEFDGKLPDYSPAGLKATGDWLQAQRDEFAAFTDAQLDDRRRFQRDYVLAVIDGNLFWLQESGVPYSNPAF